MTKGTSAPHTGVIPYIACENCAEAIALYTKAFGAVERYRLPMPNGKIGHAEIEIEGTSIMLSDANPAWGSKSAKELGGSAVNFCLYVKDVDAAFEKAKKAGFTELYPLQDQFWGDRMGSLTDPFGHKWSLAQHLRDVSVEEMKEGMRKMEEC